MIQPAPHILKMMAHDVRWQLLRALALSDRRVQELADILQRPQNLVSYHLRLLRDHNLVRERRSSADGRDVYYTLDLEYVRAQYQQGGQALHPALTYEPATEVVPANTPATPATRVTAVDPATAAAGPPEPYRVLFLCTHNSARSQLAEGILRATGGELVLAFSAGNEPSRVHPLAIRAAAALQIDISQQRSKHLDELAGQQFDAIITVCDRLREACPVFPNDPLQIHWSFPDPAAVAGDEATRFSAFLRTARELVTRIGYLRLMLERRRATEPAGTATEAKR